MKKFVLVLLISICIWQIGISQSFWNQQTSNTTVNLQSVFFVNNSTGYCAGKAGTILKTTNGGANWNTLISSTTGDLNSIFFPDVNTGYAVGYDNNNYLNVIIKTTDGGTTWLLKNVGIENYNINLKSVFFTSVDTGFVVGNGSNGFYIVKTTDGGENWTIVKSGTIFLNSICFASSKIGYSVGNNGYWYKTIDGGNNWVLQNQIQVTFGSYTVNPSLNSVFFINNNIGYAAGGFSISGNYRYVILKTINAGGNWIQSGGSNGSTSGYNFNSIFFPSQDTGYVVGDANITGKIMKTYDDGNNWCNQSSGTSYSLTSVYFTDDNTGYAVGVHGVILKTTNGGCNISIPGTPYGTDTLCKNPVNTIYTTSGASNTTGYSWLLDPGLTAGIINGNGLTSTIDWVNTYSGNAKIYVQGYSSYCYGPMSAPLSVTIVNNAPLQASTPAGPTDLCENSANTTYTTNGASYATSYIWDISPSNAGIISGNNTSAIIDWNDTFVGNASISVKGVNICGEGSFSSNLSITIYSPTANAGTISGNTTVCQGQNSVTYSVPTIANATSYIWSLPNGATGSSNTNNIIVNYGASAVSGSITVKGNNACGNGAASNLAITVNPTIPVSVSISVSPSIYVCEGTNVTFNATPTNGGTLPTYQWQVSGINIPGETNSTYSSTSLTSFDIITCTLTSNIQCASLPATSNSISLVVSPNISSSINISANPAGAICAGTNVTFTANPFNGGTSPTYQWKKGGANINGATNSTYTSATLINGDNISCIMTSNATCATGSPATSNSILMTVNPALPASLTIAANPSGAICAGTSVTFTALPVNGGTSPNYQWRIGGTNISGETNSTFTNTFFNNGDIITCVMTSNASPCLTGSPATSNTITMAVNAVSAASLSISANPAGAVCAGTSVTFTASPVNGGTAPTYQWKKNGSNIGGATNATWSSSALVSGDNINCVMTSNLACVTGSPATSNTVTVAVNSLPVANAGVNQTVCTGKSVTLNASGGASYNWNNGVTDGVPFVPASTNTYIVTVTDGNGCSATDDVLITVNPVPSTPVITTVSNYIHSSAGTGNQWYLNNSPINGATSQNYTPLVNGTYYVIVTINNCSSDTSNIITVTNVGIAEITATGGIAIYPNPTNSVLSIELAPAGAQNLVPSQTSRCKVYDILGSLIIDKTFTGNKTQIDARSLSKGLYLLRLENEEGVAVRRFIKE